MMFACVMVLFLGVMLGGACCQKSLMLVCSLNADCIEFGLKVLVFGVGIPGVSNLFCGFVAMPVGL